jgi:hypothetical protein
MQMSVEELEFVFKLARESAPVPVTSPAPKPVEPPERISPPPKDGSDSLLLCHALNALEVICSRSQCATCSLYRGSNILCCRNTLLHWQRTRFGGKPISEQETTNV